MSFQIESRKTAMAKWHGSSAQHEEKNPSRYGVEGRAFQAEKKF